MATTIGSTTRYFGTAAQIQALSANIGDTGFATDTYAEYTNTDGGTTWVQTKGSTSGATDVVTQAGSVWSYGDWPATYYNEVSDSAAATDDLLLFTETDLREYNVHFFQCSDGAVDVEVSLDGTTFTDAVAIQALDNGQTVVTFVAVTSGTDVFMLRGKYRAIRVRNTAAATATCVMVSGVM